jgi:hypothetical protein
MGVLNKSRVRYLDHAFGVSNLVPLIYAALDCTSQVDLVRTGRDSTIHNPVRSLSCARIHIYSSAAETMPYVYDLERIGVVSLLEIGLCL